MIMWHTHLSWVATSCLYTKGSEGIMYADVIKLASCLYTKGSEGIIYADVVKLALMCLLACVCWQTAMMYAVQCGPVGRGWTLRVMAVVWMYSLAGPHGKYHRDEFGVPFPLNIHISIRWEYQRFSKIGCRCYVYAEVMTVGWTYG